MREKTAQDAPAMVALAAALLRNASMLTANDHASDRLHETFLDVRDRLLPRLVSRPSRFMNAALDDAYEMEIPARLAIIPAED